MCTPKENDRSPQAQTHESVKTKKKKGEDDNLYRKKENANEATSNNRRTGGETSNVIE